MIEGMLEVKFRNQVFNLRTTFRIIEIDGITIRSREMRDNVHGIDASGRFFRIFNIELDVRLRKNSIDFGFKRFERLNTLRSSLRIVFGIIIEKEVDHRAVNTRFTETIVLTIFLRDINKLLIRLQFDITIKFTSSEDNFGIRINVFAREFNTFLEFFIESLRAFKIRIHVEKNSSVQNFLKSINILFF